MVLKKQKRKLQLKKRRPKKLNFGDHLQELKNRILIWFVIFFLASTIGYFFYQPLLNWLILPLKSPLFYTSPVGALQAVFGISVLFGFIISLPILLYQVICFLQPAIKKQINYIFIYIFVSLILVISGVLTAYYLILPATLEFLAKFSAGKLQALISTQDYFSFVAKYFLGFAIIFQFPLIIYILGKFVNLEAKVLIKYWRHVIVASFIVAAILTPTPDPINQTIMATPIIILYIISVLILALNKKLFRLN